MISAINIRRYWNYTVYGKKQIRRSLNHYIIFVFDEISFRENERVNLSISFRDKRSFDVAVYFVFVFGILFSIHSLISPRNFRSKRAHRNTYTSRVSRKLTGIIYEYDNFIRTKLDLCTAGKWVPSTNDLLPYLLFSLPNDTSVTQLKQ